MKNNQSLVLSATVTSESTIPIITLLPTDRYLEIQVEGSLQTGRPSAGSEYFTRVYVDEKKVIKSTNAAPPALTWELTVNNEMWVFVL